MQRVIAYIDGYNLYYGLRSKRWRRFYWLNLQTMTELLLERHQTLVATKYFTTIVTKPQDKHVRQATFLEALRTLSNFTIHYGHFLQDDVTCSRCKHTYTTHHEKMTDVNIAVELMCDAFQDQFDVALLVSGDSDLVGPIEAVKRLFGNKRIVAAFPPNRVSSALKRAAHGYRHINRSLLAKSVFPDRVVTAGGFELVKPASWP